MLNYYDRDPRLERWAEVIVDFCTNVKPGERVEITGEILAQPLMLALYRRCLEKGAFPALRPSFGEAIEIFYHVANDAQLEDVSPIALFEANTYDVSLHVLAESNTRNMTGIDPTKMSKVRKARQDLSR